MFLILLLAQLACWKVAADAQCPKLDMSISPTALTGIATPVKAALSWDIDCFDWKTLNQSSLQLNCLMSTSKQGTIFQVGLPVFAFNTSLKPVTAVTLPAIHFESHGDEMVIIQVRSVYSTVEESNWTATQHAVRVLPRYVALVPPIFCIFLAVFLKQPLVSMALALWLANLLVHPNPIIALHHSIATYTAASLQDTVHARVLVFVVMMAGLIGIMGRCGGLQGLADMAIRLATDSQRVQLCMWALGLAVFFSDYASCLLVGTTMRIIADRLHVSREKCAFIVDSTASPISSLAPVSAWAAYETGLIAAGLKQIGSTQEPYMLFLCTLPYRFYPILMIVLGFLLTVFKRDYYVMSLFENFARLPSWQPGSPSLQQLRAAHLPKAAGKGIHWLKLPSRDKGQEMIDMPTEHLDTTAAESELDDEGHQHQPMLRYRVFLEKVGLWLRCFHCQSSSQMEGSTDNGHDVLSPKAGAPHRWFNAAVPIAILVSVGFGGLLVQGRDTLLAKRQMASDKGLPLGPELNLSFVNTINSSSPLLVLLTACGLANIIGIVMILGQRILAMHEIVEAWIQSAASLVGAMTILVMAWAFGQALQDIHTPEALLSLVGVSLPAGLLPAIVFLLAAFVSFCTGTSWGTMSIMFPLAVPLAHALAPNDDHHLTVTISSILTGSVFGDHCSPFSDSTILSATACGCDLLTHVRTQFPYAITVAIVGLLCGDLLVGLNVIPLWVAYPLAIAGLMGCIWLFGHKVPVYRIPAPEVPNDSIDSSSAALQGTSC